MPVPISIQILPEDAHRMIEALEYYLISEATEVCRRFGYIPDDDPIHVYCYNANVARREAIRTRAVLKRLHQQPDSK